MLQNGMGVASGAATMLWPCCAAILACSSSAGCPKLLRTSIALQAPESRQTAATSAARSLLLILRGLLTRLAAPDIRRAMLAEEAGPSGAGAGKATAEDLAAADAKFERGIQCIRVRGTRRLQQSSN